MKMQGWRWVEMDSNNSKAITRNGFFSIGSHHDLPGRLFLQGSNSILHIWFNHSSDLDIIGDQDFIKHHSINGILDDGNKVSLIKCVLIGRDSSLGPINTFTNLKFFPSYVILGHNYLCDSDETIAEVSFRFDDEYALLNNHNLLNSSFPSSNQLEELNRLKIFDKIKLKEENNPIIAYSIGNSEVFSIDTTIGNISVHNSDIINEGFKGIHMRRYILTNIKFINSLNIEEMREKINKILRLVEIISGRPQNLLEIKIITQEDKLRQLCVHLNTYPKYENNSEPGCYNVLVNAASKPDQFANLMSDWLKRDENEEWQNARHRFSNVWSKQERYSPDRIVAAANMFDLLPGSIFPEEIELPRDLIDAIQASKELFKKLSCSSERDNFLAYLGQIKKLSLKKKIRHRSQLIKNIIQDDLREIDKITDEAVELRHFYVHGDKPNGRRKKLVNFTRFLTDTLEFVFCVSDLIDLNWDFLSWYKKPGRAGHPFNVYMYNYPDQSTEFLNYLEGISG